MKFFYLSIFFFMSSVMAQSHRSNLFSDNFEEFSEAVVEIRRRGEITEQEVRRLIEFYYQDLNNENPQYRLVSRFKRAIPGVLRLFELPESVYIETEALIREGSYLAFALLPAFQERGIPLMVELLEQEPWGEQNSNALISLGELVVFDEAFVMERVQDWAQRQVQLLREDASDEEVIQILRRLNTLNYSIPFRQIISDQKEEIKKVVARSNTRINESLINLMRKDPSELPFIIELALNDEGPEFNTMIAIESMLFDQEINPDHINALIDTVVDESGDLPIRRKAAMFLLNFSEEFLPRADGLLRVALYHEDRELKRRLNTILGSVKFYIQDYLPMFREALAHANEQIRLNAILTLGQFRAEGVQSLIPFLNEKLVNLETSLTEKVAILDTLGSLYEYAVDSLPTLELLLNQELGPELNTKVSQVKLIIEQANQSLVIPHLSDEATNVCQAIQRVKENSSWRSNRWYNPEGDMPPGTWDVALFSLGDLFLKKEQRVSQGPDCTSLANGEFANSLQFFLAYNQTQPLGNTSSTDIYASTFLYSMAKLRNESSFMGQLEEIIEDGLGSLQLRDNLGNSGYTTFAYGVSLLSLGNQLDSSILDRFDDWYNEFSDPLALPYLAGEHSLPESRMASIARNIPIHLFAYLNKERLTSPEEKMKNLIDSLIFFHENMGNLASEVPRNGTHVPPNGLAPYYFYSSLPYVTASLKILEKSGALSEQQREQVAEIKADLRNQLPKLIDENGLRLLQGTQNIESSYPSAEAYNYPLYGLSLIPLIEEGDECYDPILEDEFGIVVLE